MSNAGGLRCGRGQRFPRYMPNSMMPLRHPYRGGGRRRPLGRHQGADRPLPGPGRKRRRDHDPHGLDAPTVRERGGPIQVGVAGCWLTTTAPPAIEGQLHSLFTHAVNWQVMANWRSPRTTRFPAAERSTPWYNAAQLKGGAVPPRPCLASLWRWVSASFGSVSVPRLIWFAGPPCAATLVIPVQVLIRSIESDEPCREGR